MQANPAAEREVRLKHGWRDAAGKLHTSCVLRPARVRDEVSALGDFRVFLRRQSLPLVLLSRVARGQGDGEPMDVGRLERLDAEDLRVLQEAYCEMNGFG